MTAPTQALKNSVFIKQWLLTKLAMLALLGLVGCSQSFESGNEFNLGSSNETVQVDVSHWQQQCESCHKSEQIRSEANLRAWAGQSESALTDYISRTMPINDPAACVGQCASESARYMLAVLAGSAIEDVNQQPSNPDEKTPTDNSTNPSEPGSGNQPEPEKAVAPEAPSNLAIERQDNHIRLTWQDNSNNETAFKLWRKIGQDSWVAFQVLASNRTEFSDLNLPEKMISYRLSAENAAGSSLLTATVSVDLTPIDSGTGACNVPAYQAGTQYASGDQVQKDGRIFSCKTGVSAWCSSTADWAYAPVSGLHWQEAWEEQGSCDSTPVPEQPKVSLNAPTFVRQHAQGVNIELNWLDNAHGESGYLLEKTLDGKNFGAVAALAADTEAFIDTDNKLGDNVQYRLLAVNGNERGTAVSSQIFSLIDTNFNAASYYQSDCAACHGASGEGNSNLKLASFAESTLDMAAMAASISQTMPVGKVDDCTGACAEQMAEFIFAQFMPATNQPKAVKDVFIGANQAQSLINLSWSDQSDSETGFLIERSVNNASFAELTVLAANVTSYTDRDVSTGNSYQYRITTVQGDQRSMAIETSVLKLELQVTLPLKPTGLAVSLLQNVAELSWQDRSDNESGFILQKRQDGGAWSNDMQIPANQSAYSDSAINSGHLYEYRLLATNSAGDSMWSELARLDLTSNFKTSYDNHCAGCHRDGGLSVDLTTDFAKQSWQDKSWDDFLAKVNTMNTSNCDGGCKEQAARYIWAESWGLATDIEIATDARGVRGLRLLTAYEYVNSVADVFGFDLPADKVPADRHATEFRFAADAHAGVVIYDRLNEFLLLAEYIAERATASHYGCSASCSASQLKTLLEHAFRKEIDDATVNEYMSFQSNHGREDLVASIMLSPWFLYRSELGQWDATKQAYRLTDYEVATALAYQLWGTTPDANLLAKAKAGQLSSAAEITQQAKSMIADARAAQHLVEFVKYYSHTQGNIAEKAQLSQAMIANMAQEQQQAVLYALTSGSATLDELFNPGYTFVNEALARHYDMTGITGTNMRKVVTERERGGLLAQGIVQVHNSDFAATSLVKRGKFIRENLMCHTLGVPVGVDPATISMPNYPVSTRERWDIITGPNASQGQCWACHQLMNEPGSVLESYDENGIFRTSEPAYNDASVSVAIETAGVLRSNDAASTLLQYADARQLSEYLANSAVGQDCFVENYVRFATGYEQDALNQADVDQWQSNFRSGGEIWPLVEASIAAESFLYRLDRQ